MAATSSSKKKREEPMIVSTIVSSGTGCSQESGSNDIIEIDGSIKEGGGQILRIAMAISCLLRKPIRVVKIRAGRSNPGLRPQHLTGIQLVARICNGKLIGDHPGSTEISFFPGPLQGGNHSADTRTAGSICLLIQIALPCLIFAKQASQLILKGGTDVDMAPTIDYIIKVFQPLIQLAGVHFDCTVVKKGFFPKGRGEVHIAVNPIQAHVNPICLMDKGTITDINIEAFISGNVPRKVHIQITL
jgi:RNA 3'-terminal phosphate cyclase (ATP)